MGQGAVWLSRLAMAGWAAWVAIAGLAALGAQAAGPPGFVVSPAFGYARVGANQARAEYTLKLTNHNAVDQNFRLSVVDFGSLDEEGGVAFLGAPATELEHRYGLASWVSLESNTVFVPAGQSVNLVVAIENRPSLSPGGHYGAVLATAVTEGGTPLHDSVGVRQVLSSLILAVKDGGVSPELKLVSQTADGSFLHLPGRVEQRFQNVGNVHVVPRGTVEVKDPAGRVVERSAINDGSTVVLPESFRRYASALVRVRPAFWPGRYTVVSTYRPDGTDASKTLTTGFWYAGALVVWLVGILALAAVGFLGWWLLVRPRKEMSKK